ncbi:P-loop containing nucleoside triphosphate hydrolase protein [Neoconidiobolus thromboides FSU 785]|nr:P-loop containing nucleoside triphosphate hydrolase protein [Neoconidiobolus thromboides FSU 785]
MALNLYDANTKDKKYMKNLPKLVYFQVKIALLRFFTFSFQSLDNSLVREQCLKLTTISIWHNLCSEARREEEIAKSAQLKRLWKHSEKKFNSKDEEEKKNLIKDRTFLSDLVKLFVKSLYSIDPSEGYAVDEEEEALILYCERMMEFLIDLISQLPTRRFFNTLLKDHYLLNYCKESPLTKSVIKGQKFNQLLADFEFYTHFEINDFTGQSLNKDLVTETLYKDVHQFVLICFKHFEEELKSLILSHVSALTNRDVLLKHLRLLSIEDLIKLCGYLNMRTEPITLIESEKEDYYSKQFLLNCLALRYEKRKSQLDLINSYPLFPNESAIFDQSIIDNQFYNGEFPLALPKLNLQFLTLHDYLIRNFQLFRLDAYYEIRQDIEDAIKRLSPRYIPSENATAFSGWARMACEINRLSITDIKKPKLGQITPSRVIADIQLDLGRYTESIRNEWKSLKQHDILFLLTIQATTDSSKPYIEGSSFQDHFGITTVRGCEVIDILDDEGKPVNEVGKPRLEDPNAVMQAPLRTIRVDLDPNQYQNDLSLSNGHTIYQSFNIVLRRKPKDNNFKAVSQTIRDLMQSELIVPDWLKSIVLGYGDPSGAHYSNFELNNDEFYFNDTFIDFDHIKESFPNTSIVALNENMIPPFVLKFPSISEPPSKKQKGESNLISTVFSNQNKLEFKSHKALKKGPYTSDEPHKNQIRFTPTQIEAIYSGCNKGLSLIVGPPGTGKTDVAVQIISNLYHNHPKQKVLLVTHSNQALNQLFTKIAALDIDPRHLLRLGHGHEELDMEESFSKYGRVNSFLEQRITLLEQVNRLVKVFELEGDHAHSCESALHFYQEYVEPKWDEYLKLLGISNNQNSKISDSITSSFIANNFPFTGFFIDAPKPLVPEDKEEAVEAIFGCYRHITHLFDQIKTIYPFELLRSSKDRADYLLVKEARIVAMTCTHAALKRRELVRLGFTYENLILEEAAQILEIETFIPLVLQETPLDQEAHLQRVVLIGDHKQLPPVVRNLAFQKYGNMGQSLFSRLIRLGVPKIQLDSQGRSRPQIADLYRYRYPGLGDLSHLTQGAFKLANSGFAHPFQFINVNEGQGETCPVPFFYQNLVEAEYVVAMYQYMRLIGYPASKITILATYNGQISLIKDIISVRCSKNPLLGNPAKISTVDKYQGEQNDYILLSLVRTKAVGHLRDIRRMTVALSRAKLGLYVFGNKNLFMSCSELQQSIAPFFQNKGDKLVLVKEESYPTDREVTNTPSGQQISGLKEMGILVHEMLKEQMESQSSALDETNNEVPMED